MHARQSHDEHRVGVINDKPTSSLRTYRSMFPQWSTAALSEDKNVGGFDLTGDGSRQEGTPYSNLATIRRILRLVSRPRVDVANRHFD